MLLERTKIYQDKFDKFQSTLCLIILRYDEVVNF